MSEIIDSPLGPLSETAEPVTPRIANSGQKFCTKAIALVARLQIIITPPMMRLRFEVSARRESGRPMRP